MFTKIYTLTIFFIITKFIRLKNKNQVKFRFKFGYTPIMCVF